MSYPWMDVTGNPNSFVTQMTKVPSSALSTCGRDADAAALNFIFATPPHMRLNEAINRQVVFDTSTPTPFLG